jgi:hypothetical protein
VSSRPILLVDVDGVLNPYGFDAPPEGFQRFDVFSGEEPVLVSRMHGRWLRELGAVFDLMWATSWNDDANRLLAPLLGIEALPVVSMPEPPFPPSAKVGLIAAAIGSSVAAWLDDQHGEAAQAWANARRDPTLLVGIEPAIGLRRNDVDRLLAWSAVAGRG